MSKDEQIQTDIEKRLDDDQNEYHEILHNIFNNNMDMIDKDRGYTYYWERVKRLQQNIINLTFVHREQALEKAKLALEKAFTPRIRKMLEEKVKDENNE